MKNNLIKIAFIILTVTLLGKFVYVDKFLTPSYEEKQQELSEIKSKINYLKLLEAKYGDYEFKTDEELEELVQDGYTTDVNWIGGVSSMFETIGFVEDSNSLVEGEYNFTKVSNKPGAVTVEDNGSDSKVVGLNQVTISLTIWLDAVDTVDISEEEMIKGIYNETKLYNISMIDIQDSQVELELISFYR